MTLIGLIILLAQASAGDLAAHVNAGLKAKAAGDLETAIREFQRVAELAPQLPAAHTNLGAVQFAKKDYAGAIASLRRAVALDDKLSGAHQMLGTALLTQGYAVTAIPHLEKVQANDLLGIALLEADRPRDAVDKLEAALGSRPNDPDLLYYLSQAHGRLSQQLFEKLRNTPGAEPRLAQMLGEAAAAAGQREAAEKHFREALAKRPELHGVNLAIGELHLASGDYARAEAAFRAETALAPGSTVAAYKLGLTLANRGKPREAAVELERAYHASPEMPETSLELGKALLALNEHRRAEEALRRVVAGEAKGKLAEAAWLQLNALYRKTGRAAEADAAMKALRAIRGQ